MTDQERFQGEPRDSQDFSGLSPMQVVGRFVSARMSGLELSVDDVSKNTNLSSEEVVKMVEGNLDFDILIGKVSAVEKYLDFDLDLQKLLIRLSIERLGAWSREWGGGDKPGLPTTES